MSVYVDTVYPLVLAACGALLIFGVTLLITPRAHAVAKLAWRGFMIVIGVQALSVAFALVSSDVDTFKAIAYTVTALAVLALLGISRLAAKEAAPADPERPVLTVGQAAKVDGAAAVLVAIAQAIVSWRIHDIMIGAA